LWVNVHSRRGGSIAEVGWLVAYDRLRREGDDSWPSFLSSGRMTRESRGRRQQRPQPLFEFWMQIKTAQGSSGLQQSATYRWMRRRIGIPSCGSMTQEFKEALKYASRYRRRLGVVLALSILSTIFSLVLPYLSRSL